ncbi:MAG: class I SAM-dependent methyltransferase [Desulfobacterales bacterium]|nr:class I SAM-dependent methyltransferase [Desulfobacterales bacterium]
MISNCPYCNNHQTETIFSAHLPQVVYPCPESMVKTLHKAPFELRICGQCKLGFNASPLSPEALCQTYDNYNYISPLTGIGTTKYQGMLDCLTRFCSPEDQMVEIGCSQGYLIQALNRKGYHRVKGFEPGPQALEGQALGLDITQTYYTTDTFPRESVDCFYLMHVFEHFDDPFAILESMVSQLSSRGKIIIEVPNFNGFHHQHLFFYSPDFFNRLARDFHLTPVDTAIDTSTGAQALRTVWVHDHNPVHAQAPPQTMDPVPHTRQLSSAFKKTLEQIHKALVSWQGKPVFWWGSGSASIIYLNQLDPDIISGVDLTIVDGDPKKWGLFVPGTGHPIHPHEILKQHRADHLIIGSSFYKEILETIAAQNLSTASPLIIKEFI